MRSAQRGGNISAIEVTNVSKHGFWILIGDHERFVPFDLFPWFRAASIGELCNVDLPSQHHLYWPDLDIDLAVESIDHPELYPLVSRVRSRVTTSPQRKTGRATYSVPPKPGTAASGHVARRR